MDPEVAAAAQAGHWSDPCEVCMWHTGTTSRGGEAAASQGVPRAPARPRGGGAGGPGTPRESGGVSGGYI